MRITHNQLRAARSLLNLNQGQVAEAAGMTAPQLSKFETGLANLHPDTLNRLVLVYEMRGLEFLDHDGIRQRGGIVELAGREGFRTLMDDVYASASNAGGDIAILNGCPSLFIKYLGEEWYAMHAARMAAVKDKINFRITAERGEPKIAKTFAEYRFIEDGSFENHSSYIYGGKVAFIDFDDGVRIDLCHRRSLHVSLSNYFNYIWNELEK